MIPVVIEGHHDVIGKPRDWTPEQGQCVGLPVRFDKAEGGLTFMRSAWEPTDEELVRMVAGGKLLLGISAPQHPVVQIGVGDPTVDAGEAAKPHYLINPVTDSEGKSWVRAIVVVGTHSFPAGLQMGEGIDFATASARLIRALEFHMRGRGLIQ